MALNVLFIGGTGQISYPCVERAVAQGHHVSVFNRGLRGDPLPAGVTSITGELGSAAYADLAKANYDVVCSSSPSRRIRSPAISRYFPAIAASTSSSRRPRSMKSRRVIM